MTQKFKTETPEETYKRVFDEIKYGVEVQLKGCRGSDGFICPINSSMNWQAVDKTVGILCYLIIKETLDEYTNDENHDRIEHWKAVKEFTKATTI